MSQPPVPATAEERECHLKLKIGVQHSGAVEEIGVGFLDWGGLLRADVKEGN
jgi:hypothetical protein